MGMVYGNFNQKIFQNLNIPYISTIKGAKKAPLKYRSIAGGYFSTGKPMMEPHSVQEPS